MKRITPALSWSRRPRPPGPLTPTLTLLALVAAVVPALLRAVPAQAAELDVRSPRSLGMGETLRGAAAGSSALFLNPSGMSLTRSYVIEAGYQNAQPLHGHVAHLAIADSTSAFNLGGGVYYTYATASPEARAGLGRHEGGLALSLPLGDAATIGATGRYLRTWIDQGPAAAPSPASKKNGFTFDAGLTIRAGKMISLGLVGYGLRDLGTSQATRSFGGGVAVIPTGQLALAVDAVTAKLGDDRRLTVSGGAEYTFATSLAVRLGGGSVQDGEAFGTAGLSLLSEVGALDIGGRLDMNGKSESLYLGLAARLFIPTP
jgi:hypothetical protein